METRIFLSGLYGPLVVTNSWAILAYRSQVGITVKLTFKAKTTLFCGKVYRKVSVKVNASPRGHQLFYHQANKNAIIGQPRNNYFRGIHSFNKAKKRQAIISKVWYYVLINICLDAVGIVAVSRFTRCFLTRFENPDIIFINPEAVKWTIVNPDLAKSTIVNPELAKLTSTDLVLPKGHLELEGNLELLALGLFLIGLCLFVSYSSYLVGFHFGTLKKEIPYNRSLSEVEISGQEKLLFEAQITIICRQQAIIFALKKELKERGLPKQPPEGV